MKARSVIIPAVLIAGCFAVGYGIGKMIKGSKEEAPEVPGKYIALSFDDGPEPTTTPLILDLLEEYDIPASFFLWGEKIVPEREQYIKRAVSLGCDIENHSFTHKQMTRLSDEEILDEIEKTSAAIENVIGKRPEFFRPPFINHDQRLHDLVDLTFINGLNCMDWEGRVTTEQRIEGMRRIVDDGVIFLLHDFDENYNTVEMLKTIIPEFKEQGYTFVTVPELFKRFQVEPQRDSIYSKLSYPVK